MVVALNRATAFKDLSMKEVTQIYEARGWAADLHNKLNALEEIEEKAKKEAAANAKIQTLKVQPLPKKTRKKKRE